MDDRQQLPADFWSTPTVASALGTCDISVLMELVRTANGWSQADLAAALGYSQSWVSRVLRRQHMLTVDQVRKIARGLDIPLNLLRLGTSGGGERSTKRRDFGKVVAAAGLTMLPAVKTSTPAIDDDTPYTLRTITGGQRHLDRVSPARDLVGAAVSHVEVANRMLSRCRDSAFAPHVAAATSEAAGFAAWLHVDLRDTGTARRYYRMAVDRARMAGMTLLAGYMLGSLAAFEIEDGDPMLGLDLVARARRQLGSDRPYPTARAWLGCIEALGHATARAATDADQALIGVSRALDQIDHADRPPWPWMFPFDHGKAAGYRARVSVRLKRHTQATAAFAEAMAAAQLPAKQHALLALEVAETGLQFATDRHRSDEVDHAFDVAADALRVGISYGSERVVHRARRLRRSYRGPVTGRVEIFDWEMKGTLP